MIRRLGILLTAAVLAMPLTAAETQRYLVSTREGASASRLRIAANATLASKHRVRSFGSVNAFAADLTAAEAAELRASGNVIVEPVLEREILGEGPVANETPVQPATAAQSMPWGINAVHAPSVWPVTKGENVNVVVLDTGIDATHPDLAHAYVGGYNFFDPTKPPVDEHRHGTHVAGTIAAANNEVGVVGVAPGVKLWAVKVLGRDGKGTTESIIGGLNWVIEKAKTTPGRWVANFSLGSNDPSEIEHKVVREALAQNIVVIAAAGNRSMDLIKYPAGYEGVIAVGATTEDNKRASFSSYGLGLTLMAPGAKVQSTIIKGFSETTDVMSGAELLESWSMDGSPYASVTGRLVNCGYGEPHEFPANMQGKIAFLRRGVLKFREKVRNAKNAGAAAVIIQGYNSDTRPAGGWTLLPSQPEPEWEGYQYILSVGVLYEVGEKLLQSNEDVTVTFRSEEYAVMNGTSMASPHVAGTVALMLSLAPDLPIAQIDYVLRHTARDIYGPGWDYETAWGVLDTLAAVKFVAPQKFGESQPPPIPSPRRRSVGR